MHEQPATGSVTGGAVARLAEFARSCKAAARAVSLYPPGHPAIVVSLRRLTQVTAALTQEGPFRIRVTPDTLTLEDRGAAPPPAEPPAAPLAATPDAPRPDPAIAELAFVLHRHFIGRLTLNAGADAESWRTLLLLLSRPPDEVRSDGGITHLWTTAGGPSIEIEEIDYAEVLREKQGVAAAVDQIIAAALEGSRLELDDSGMRLLLEIVQDPARLQDLMAQIEQATADRGADAHAAAFLALVRGLSQWLSRNDPGRLDAVIGEMGRAAGRLSAEAMLQLLEERRRGAGGDLDAAGAVLDRMSDESLAGFVATSVIKERGATERLAQAFQALVPDFERQRSLVALARDEVANAEGTGNAFAELWERVEGMLLSYSDETYVSEQYARELSTARGRAIDVEQISDDPPERIGGWLATVSDAALRSLDQQLLMDLLHIEEDVLRWRDIAETAAMHAEDLIRVGYFDQAWQLAEAILAEGARQGERRQYAAAAVVRLGRSATMKHIAAHLRTADDGAGERFRVLCHAIGPALIAPLAESLSTEQDARSRRRLRDILVGFGAGGREAVRQLMQAPNWEVRRTAAYLLREIGGSEGLKELEPLLADSEPLVQREAVQGLIRNGSDEASRILLHALLSASGRGRETLAAEIAGTRADLAAPLYTYLVRHMDPRRDPPLYVTAVDALGGASTPDAIEALKAALYGGGWRTPFVTRRVRSAAARALRRIGSPAAVDVLHAAATGGTFGVRAAARAELGGARS